MRDVGIGWLATSLAILPGCLVDVEHPCGDELEPAKNGACVCPDGLRLLAGHCVEVDDTASSANASCALGAACECEASSNCPQGELCDLHGSGRCTPAPAGLGNACSSAADCAGSAATYCDTFATRTCQVQGCKELGAVCPGDYLCCDFAILSTSLCIPPDIAAGQCPAPGMLLMRGGAP